MSLKFKGDKPKKKKRSHKEVDGDNDGNKGEGSSSGSVRSRYGKDVEGGTEGLVVMLTMTTASKEPDSYTGRSARCKADTEDCILTPSTTVFQQAGR